MATMSNLATEKRNARIRITQENRRVELTLMHWGDVEGYGIEDILYHPQLFNDFLKENHKVFDFLYLLECPSLWEILEFDDTFTESYWLASLDTLDNEAIKSKVFGLIEEIKIDLKTWLENQEDISDLDELTEVNRLWSLGENKISIRTWTNYEDKNVVQVLINCEDF
jgi:hypothetical protein